MAFIKKKEKENGKSLRSKPSKISKPLYKKKGNGFCSIDFGEDSLKFACGNSSNNRLRVDKLFSYPLPDGVYRSGKIQDVDVMAETIKKALSENKVSCKNVIAVMDSMEIIKRELQVPVLDYEDTINYIKFDIGEYLPIDVSTYLVQYKEIERKEVDGEEKIDVIAYTFPKEIAAAYYETFEKAKLNPCVLDVYPNALEKLIETQYINGEKANKGYEAIIYFDIDMTFMTILKNGKYDFSRILETNNSFVTDFMSKNLASEEEALKFVSKYKKENIFEKLEDPEEELLQKNAIGVIDETIQEVSKILQYWNSRDRENRLDRIFIAGEYMELKDLDIYFEGKLGIHTNRVYNISDVDESLLKDSEDLAKYVNAISGLIRRV